MNTLPNLQRDEISHFGGIKTDVALSLWEYNDFIDCLLDERFTADGLLRMKHLSKHLAMSALVTPIFTFPFAYIATQWMNGWVNRGMANTRLNIAGMAMLYPVFLYYTVTRPIPRKLYTDIICDSGPDGQYVREVLRTKKPGLWKKISAQLHTNNFSFPEMIEFKGIDFTSDFVQNRVI